MQEKQNELSCSKTLFKNLLMGGEKNSSTLQFPLPGNSAMTQRCFSLSKANVGAARRRIIKLTHRKNIATLQRRQKKSLFPFELGESFNIAILTTIQRRANSRCGLWSTEV